MKKNYLIFAIIGTTFFIAILTNPNQDRHKEVIKNKINSYMQKAMKQDITQTGSKLGQAIGMMMGGALVDRIVDNLVSTDNYVLFSTTKISWEGEMKVIGIGAFGNVFVTNKLDEAMNEGLLKK